MPETQSQTVTCNIYILNHSIGLVSRVFTHGLGDWGLIPKTQKMVLDTSLRNTQHYKGMDQG